ncbi:response regulator [Vibrio harveyi]|uniref:response regulator n=1 Tax=Vibrio harveyi TaxID=669 RepID=UPI001558AE0C|nr:response regulator [Vibrio harveyi]
MSNRAFNVLVVEDDTELSSFIESTFHSKFQQVNVVKAFSRNAAFEILDSEAFFDYVTLDLSIPDIDGSFDTDASNGLAVLGKITEVSSGTPVLVLTGTSTVDMIQDFLSHSNLTDVWGSGNKRGTIEHLTKSRIGELTDKINQISQEFSSSLNVELVTAALSLPIKHDRLLRVFINSLGANLGIIRQIGGGLSSAKVYSVHIQDFSGRTLHLAICKCGPKEDINADAQNYHSYINRLRPDATPRKLGHLEYSAGDSSGVFYGLAENYDASFFKASLQNELNEELMQSIKLMLAPWHQNIIQNQKLIREIRAQLVSDSVAERLIKEFDLTEALAFEAMRVICRTSCTHGDFHGENILLDIPSQKATLIDYGDVCEGVSIIDPLTLECSFLFHPKTSDALSSWPTETNLENWENLEAYVEGCPFKDSIVFCRNWASELGVGNRELAACLYAYALRQLKYEGTNKKHAISLINTAYRLYQQS